jgi:hypothetical protein
MLTVTTETLKNEMNRKIAEIEKQKGILECLPISPRMVHAYPLYGSIGSASYEIEKLQDAVSILEKFEIVPAYVIRDRGTVSIRPIDDGKGEEISEIFAWVDVSQFGATIKFFAKLKCGILRVDIKTPLHSVGYYYRDNPKARINYKLKFNPSPALNSLFCAASFRPADFRGPNSGSDRYYVAYDREEIINFLESKK